MKIFLNFQIFTKSNNHKKSELITRVNKKQEIIPNMINLTLNFLVIDLF